MLRASRGVPLLNHSTHMRMHWPELPLTHQAYGRAPGGISLRPELDALGTEFQLCPSTPARATFMVGSHHPPSPLHPPAEHV